MEEHPLSARNRISPEVLAPAPGHGIRLDRAVGNPIRLEEQREAHDRAVPVAHDPEALRARAPTTRAGARQLPPARDGGRCLRSQRHPRELRPRASMRAPSSGRAPHAGWDSRAGTACRRCNARSPPAPRSAARSAASATRRPGSAGGRRGRSPAAPARPSREWCRARRGRRVRAGRTAARAVVRTRPAVRGRAAWPRAASAWCGGRPRLRSARLGSARGGRRDRARSARRGLPGAPDPRDPHRDARAPRQRRARATAGARVRAGSPWARRRRGGPTAPGAPRPRRHRDSRAGRHARTRSNPACSHQVATGGSRPATTRRVLSRSAGAKTRRTQPSSRRRTS